MSTRVHYCEACGDITDQPTSLWRHGKQTIVVCPVCAIDPDTAFEDVATSQAESW